jgi:hypothetical protein
MRVNEVWSMRGEGQLRKAGRVREDRESGEWTYGSMGHAG